MSWLSTTGAQKCTDMLKSLRNTLVTKVPPWCTTDWHHFDLNSSTLIKQTSASLAASSSKFFPKFIKLTQSNSLNIATPCKHVNAYSFSKLGKCQLKSSGIFHFCTLVAAFRIMSVILGITKHGSAWTLAFSAK